MGFAVVEEFGQGRQGQRLVVVLDILQHQREIRTHLIIIELQRLAVVAQQSREQQVHPADAAEIAVGVIFIAFAHRIVDDRLDPGSILHEEEQVIGMGIPLQNSTEEKGQQILSGQYGEDTGIEGAFAQHDAEHG